MSELDHAEKFPLSFTAFKQEIKDKQFVITEDEPMTYEFMVGNYLNWFLHKTGYESKLKEQSETIESMKGLIKELVEVLEVSNSYIKGQIMFRGENVRQLDGSVKWELLPTFVKGVSDKIISVLSKNKELIESIKGE